MQKFIVEGGIPLKGQVTISGAKNAAIKMIAASLLTPEPLILENIPEIKDVEVSLKIVESLGVKVEKVGDHKLRLRGDEVNSFRIPSRLSCLSRASVVMMGPLLHRFGRVEISQPGGCPIGMRPIDRHLEALQSLGAKISYQDDIFSGKAERLVGSTIRFEKNTVMGTESALMAAVLAEGETEILNAALEPEVDDLIELLNKMGGRIKRDEKESRRILIEGVSSMQGATHCVLPDRNEAVTFAAATAATRGDVVIENIQSAHLTAFLAKLEAAGVRYETSPSSLRVWVEEGEEFQPVNIETAPHPGFMTDWQQPFCVLLTQAQGESLIHEKIYENRFSYTKELLKMGAKIELLRPAEVGIPLDPETYNFDWGKKTEPLSVAKVYGPTPLHGAKLKISDLRAGATLVLAALGASGQSEITGIEHIDRGYERFDEKLRALGVKIERVT